MGNSREVAAILRCDHMAAASQNGCRLSKMAAASLLFPTVSCLALESGCSQARSCSPWSYYQVSDFAGREGGFAGHAPGVQDNPPLGGMFFRAKKSSCTPANTVCIKEQNRIGDCQRMACQIGLFSCYKVKDTVFRQF